MLYVAFQNLAVANIIGCEESEKNQENQMTSAPRGTGSTDTSSLQDEVFD